MHNPANSPDRIDSLTEAFAAAEYVVHAQDHPVLIRIGAATPALDRLLDGRFWAVITAHNPDGRRCSSQANNAAQRALGICLRRMRPAVLLKTSNRDPAGSWPDEPAWLFTPRSFSQVDRLARRFGQRATVTGLPGEPAVLRIYPDVRDASSGGSPAVVS